MVPRGLIAFAFFAFIPAIHAWPRHVPFSRTVLARTPRQHSTAVTRGLAGASFAHLANVPPNLRRGLSEDFNLTDLESETVYYTSLEVGTPPQTFNMLVDISLADVMVAGKSCIVGCPTDVTYDANKSSTAVNISTGPTTLTFSTGGSGQGYTFTDTMTLGSYTISNAAFLQVTETTDNFFSNPISGLLGLGFAQIAQTTKTPFWQAVISGNEATSPEFGFWLARGSGLVQQDQSVPGGVFTFGGTNTSFYSGDIEFHDLTGDNTGFWSLNVSSITMQGKSISLTKNATLAFLDTASEPIIGPAADVKAMWSTVHGASELPGNPGVYQFPCNTTFNLTVSFGGRSWPINSTDVNFGPTGSSSQCVGAITGQTPTPGSPGWIFGVAFLNIYSVFRQNPPSVGFAELSTLAGGTGAPNSIASASSSIASSTSSGAPSATSSMNSQPLKKNEAGPIAGGVIGGVAILIAAAFIIYRRRHQQETQTAEPFTDTSRAPVAHPPLSFVVDDPTQGKDSDTPNHLPRSLSSMKRAQTAAAHRFSNLPTTSDELVQTERGLQLSPGTAASESSATSSRSRPRGARAPATTGAVTSDPAVLQELQDLREQVQRLVAEQSPPGYEDAE
ncbi:Acid protease [Mycena venus]|uniref:Acid protease n=1 Tax=Mycena venus TaxID=2733690 RepID=A0A8H7CVK9_9AGAR|nr:Acid protease [Mycena venus]